MVASDRWSHSVFRRGSEPVSDHYRLIAERRAAGGTPEELRAEFGESAEPMAAEKRKRLGRELYSYIGNHRWFGDLNDSEREVYYAAAETLYREGYDAATHGLKC